MSKPTAPVIIVRLAAAFATLLFSGCAIRQHDEVAIYRGIIDNNKPADVHLTAGAPLTLTDALRLANQNEEQLSSQGESYLQALIDIDRTYASFQPNISAAANDTESNSTSAPLRRGTNTRSLSANGSINLFNGYRDEYTLRAETATAEQQKQLILDLQQTVLLDVVNAYYQVLTNEQSVEVFSNSLQVQQATVDLMQAQRRVGISRPLDVAQAEAQSAQTQVSLYAAISAVQTARVQLAFLVAAPVENSPLVNDFQPPDDVPALPDWLKMAESTRQDLLAANANVLAERENVEVAVGEYYPSLSLNLNYILQQSVNPSAGPWTAALSLSAPIFTGGLIHADVRTAWSRFRQAALAQAELRREIAQSIATAFIELQTARQEIPALEVQLRASRDALNVATEQYRAGTGTFLDQETAQQTLLSTQLELTQELFIRKTAYFNLLRAAGQLQLLVPHSTTQPTEEQLREMTTRPTTIPSSAPARAAQP